MEMTATISKGDHVLQLRFTLPAVWRLAANHGVKDSDVEKPLALMNPEVLWPMIQESYRGFIEHSSEGPCEVKEIDVICAVSHFARDELIDCAKRAWESGMMSRIPTPEEIEAGKAVREAALTGEPSASAPSAAA